MKRLLIILFLPLLAAVSLAQMTDAAIQQMTEASFAAFKANKWASFENGAYWGWKEKDGDGYRYYWEQALCMMATEQQAEYGTSTYAIDMVTQNLDGFVAKYGMGLGLGWNDYIDDIGWVLDAFCIGYRITGKPSYLAYAKLLWSVGFTRGNLGPDWPYANTVQDGSEGLWWRVPHGRYSGYDAEGLNGKAGNGQVVKNQDHYKSPLATSPHVSGGAYLYYFTRDERFLDAAEKMWQWEVNTLWNTTDDSGIHEGYNPPRPSVIDKDGNTTEEVKEGLRSRRTMHDLSSFFEATNALYQVTHKEVYLAWCWKIVNSVLYHRLDGSYVIQNAFEARDGSWCWEAGRAWTMFVADNNLWDFKGVVPLLEGTYIDYTGTEKTYTTKVKGVRRRIPGTMTIYQFMANSAKEIKDNNATCIILPTNKEVGNRWADGPIAVQNNTYYIKNIGQNKYIKTGKALGYDQPGLVALEDATPQTITRQDDGTWRIASPDFSAGWGVQGRNLIFESNNGSTRTNSWGTSLIPGWQFEPTGEKDGENDVCYIKYTWGEYTKGNTNVTDPSGKTFVLHYGQYDLSTDGWSTSQKNDIAQPWVYGGLESNLESYGDDAKWVLIPVAGAGEEEDVPLVEKVLYAFTSPSGINQVTVCMNETDSTLYLRMDHDGQTVIDNSPLGMVTNQGNFTRKLIPGDITTRTVDETYKMYTGKASEYRDYCEEVTLPFTLEGNRVKMDVVVRAYDDGVAYRYHFYGRTFTDGNFCVTSDKSTFVVGTYKRAWGQKWTYDYSQGMGKAFSWSEAQNLANNLDGQSGFGKGCFAAPLMIESTLGDDYFVLISDGGVDQWFCRGVLHASQKTNAVGRFDFLLRGEKDSGIGVTTKCPLFTPWRCAVVGSLRTIAETTMFENVTDPTQKDPTGQDWSWVQGGFHTWDWGCTENNGSFKNQTDNIDCAKKYIDFNEKVGFRYYTLDDGWRSCVFNGTTANYVKEVAGYAKSKGQGIWLWQASNGWNTTMFNTFKSYGAVGCKIDFFYDGDTRSTMKLQEQIAQYAARKGLMVSFHGTPTPTGLRRKWPNIVSYEAVDGNEDYFTGGWNNTGTDPGYNGLLSIMRNAVGPMDYTICEFRQGNNGSGTARDNTSWAQQLSQIACFESGNQWFSDALENVQGNAIIMDAIKDAPCTWDESRCLHASVSDDKVTDIQGNEDANFRVVWARRKGADWYVGGSTNPAWTYQLDCSFLDPEGIYTATIFRDGSNQTTLSRQVKQNVDSEQKFSIRCLERGGFLVRFVRTGDADGIDEIRNEAPPTPFRGSIDDNVYNLSGQRLSGTRKGVNIVGGKAVLMK